MNTLDELRDFLLLQKEVILYGAGENTHWIYYWIKEDERLSVLDLKIAVTKCAGEKYFHDEKIYEIAELAAMAETTVVLIATFSGYFDDISRVLNEYGFKTIIPIKDDFIESLYESLWRKPIIKNKILVENFHGLGYGDSPRYVVEKLLESADDLDIVWVVKPEEDYGFPPAVRTVQIYSKEYFEETATAYIWLSNVRKFHCVRKREEQYYIQTWHGFPLKTIEKLAEEASGGAPNAYFDAGKRDSAMLDILISNSKLLTDIYKETFWFDGPIVMTGFPRNDIYFTSTENVRTNVYKEFELRDETKIVLYAPTFRNDYEQNPYDLDFEVIINQFNEWYEGEWVMLVRMHPNIRYKSEDFRFGDRVIDATSYCDMAELLVSSSVLITDYSSSMFDFMYTKRPVFLYANDITQYEDRDRGFNIPYRSLPFPIAQTEVELSDAIKSYDEREYCRKLENFIEKNGFMDDGKASLRVAKMIVEKVRNYEESNNLRNI